MKGIRNAVLLPVLALGLVGTGLAAQPRGASLYFEETVPPTEEARLADKTAHMDAWLRRLTGRFRIEIPILPKDTSPNAADRMVDCVSIGAGAGVHCIFYSAQPRAAGNGQEVDELLRRDEVLRVSKVVEYGLDPNAGRIRMMVAQERSVQRITGVLNGDTVASITRCWNSSAIPPCEIIQWIDAPADDKDIWVSEQVRPLPVFRYILHRMSAEQAAEAETFIEGAREDRPGNARAEGGGSRKSGGRPR